MCKPKSNRTSMAIFLYIRTYDSSNIKKLRSLSWFRINLYIQYVGKYDIGKWRTQFTQKDYSLQKVMLAYWVNFANTGNPNDSGLVKWSQYQSSTDSYLEMKATPVGGLSGVRTAKSNLWDAAVGFTGCTSSVNVEELKNNNTILVYPIPTNEILYVKPEKNNEPFTIFVYDFTGKKIISEKNINQVNLSNFPTGIYLMTINQGGANLEEKNN